jgi:hypothetical protein
MGNIQHIRLIRLNATRLPIGRCRAARWCRDFGDGLMLFANAQFAQHIHGLAFAADPPLPIAQVIRIAKCVVAALPKPVGNFCSICRVD